VSTERATRRPGRPAIGKMWNLRFPDDLHTALKAEAASNGVTMAEQMRRILTERYEKETTK
jgi:plasmid stability protein